MRSTRQSATIHGVVGGILAAMIVVAWFLAVDLLAGDPLRTPAQLGAALFGRPDAGSGVLVLLYSLVHFGAFAIIGGVTGWFLASTGAAPGIFLGLFLGVCVLNAIHYVGLLVTNQQLLNVLPWVHVIGANLLAGVAYMTYLHRAEREEHPLGLAALENHPLIAEGLKIGFIGAAAVASWFFLVDIVAGAPFRTPAALGSAVFLGADGAAAISTSPGIIAAYTVLHLAAFAIAGIGFVAVAQGIERLPMFTYLTVMCAILLEAVTVALLIVIGQTVLGSVSIWEIGLANLLAVGSMGGWLWRTHPRLRTRVLAEGFASTP